MAWEAWFAALPKFQQEGADYWAGQRSLKQPGTCTDGAAALPNDVPDQGAFEDGCQQAMNRLAPSDVKRKADPLYEAGWNAPITDSWHGYSSRSPFSSNSRRRQRPRLLSNRRQLRLKRLRSSEQQLSWRGGRQRDIKLWRPQLRKAQGRYSTTVPMPLSNVARGHGRLA